MTDGDQWGKYWQIPMFSRCIGASQVSMIFFFMELNSTVICVSVVKRGKTNKHINAGSAAFSLLLYTDKQMCTEWANTLTPCLPSGQKIPHQQLIHWTTEPHLLTFVTITLQIPVTSSIKPFLSITVQMWLERKPINNCKTLAQGLCGQSN